MRGYVRMIRIDTAKIGCQGEASRSNSRRSPKGVNSTMDAHERAAVEHRILGIEARLDSQLRPLSLHDVVESVQLQRELGDLLRALDRPIIVRRTRRSAQLPRWA